MLVKICIIKLMAEIKQIDIFIMQFDADVFDRFSA